VPLPSSQARPNAALALRGGRRQIANPFADLMIASRDSFDGWNSSAMTGKVADQARHLI